MSKIFICYRRSEDEYAVEILYMHLVTAFGPDSVFRDVDGTHAGDKWKDVLETRVRNCQIMVVLIGPNWLTLTAAGAGGRRRLDMPDDWVRFEIEIALKSEIRIVPVLLQQGPHATLMPETGDLPESIRELRDSHAVTIRARDIMSDMQKLISDLEMHVRQMAEVQQALETYDSLVDDGEWVRAKQYLDEALGTVGAKRNGYRLLVKKQPVAKLLHTAAKAFERNDFSEAHEVLRQVPEPPHGVRAALQIAAIGSELGAAPITGDRVRSARTEIQQIARGPSSRIPGEAELVTVLDRHEHRAELDAGIEHYRNGRFGTAKRHLVSVEEGSGPWLQRIDAWANVFEALKARRWSDARTWLRGLHEEDSSRVSAVRQWCILADKFVPALTSMAEGGRVAEAAVPSEAGPASPYAVLHVSPSMPHAQALDLTYDHPDKKTECDVLSVPEKRLLVDFGTYAVRVPQCATTIVSRYFTFAANVTLDDFLERILRVFSDAAAGDTLSQHLFKTIESGLGDDAGVLFAMQSNHEQAIQRFLEAARRNPSDHMALHHLGLAACAKAYLDPAAATVADVWNLVCLAWGAVFADSRFWNAWWAQVRKIYPVLENRQIQEARSRLERFWLDELKTVEGLGDESADAFALEIRSARAVAALQGIPVGKTTRQRAIVGRRGVTALELEPQFGAMVASFTSEQVTSAGPHRNLCIAFSRFALPQAMVEAGRHADALEALEKIDPQEGPQAPADLGFLFLADDVRSRLFRETHARLLCHVHLEIAFGAIARVPLEMEIAIEHWTAALDIAKRCNATAEITARIREVVVGRARWLRSADGTKHERLTYRDDAVRLIEEAERHREWDDDARSILNELVDSLLDRAIFVSNEFDMEKVARLDALAAYRLRPNYLRSIQVLGMSTLYYARQRSSDGERDVAASLVEEVIQLLADGENRFPGNGELEKIREHAVELKALLLGDDEETLDRVLQNLSEIARCGEKDPVDPRLAEARHEEEEKHYERATDLYWELVQERPEDQEVRGRMCFCYRLWLFDLAASGTQTEKRRVLKIAKVRCADSLQLREIFEAEAEGAEA
jgi:tetratricopeptide (TPR) repeat protein